MKSKRFAEAQRHRCVACGACMKECPRNAISIEKGCYAVMDKELCVGCGKCEAVCPAGCIQLKERGKINENR